MPVSSQTKPSTPRLSEAARHVVIPSGIVTTGWPQVVAKGSELGIGFDWWQDSLGRIVLGKRADGKYAATVGGVVLSIPRQVGKTYFVGALMVILCILFPGLKVVWTAHRTRTATNTFRSLQAIVKRKKIRPYLAPGRSEGIRTANGEQEITFRNGSVIMFGAREQGFGRGFDELDIEVFDEAQILTEKALEDMVAATNQARHPHGALLFYMGTPPRPIDPGEAFTLKRTKALSGKADDLIYLECSADLDADPDDRAQWAKANFSYPTRTPLESMLRLRENLLSDEAWMREAMGVWAENATSAVIDPALWASLIDVNSKVARLAGFGFDVTPSSTAASIHAAGLRADGLAHLEPVQDEKGTDWCFERLVGLWQKWTVPIVLDPAGPAGDFVDRLEKAGVKVIALKSREYAAACQAFVTEVHAQRVRHQGWPAMAAAIAGAKQRDIGDGGWGWARKKSTANISPLVSGTLALHGLTSVPVREFWGAIG